MLLWTRQSPPEGSVYLPHDRRQTRARWLEEEDMAAIAAASHQERRYAINRELRNIEAGRVTERASDGA